MNTILTERKEGCPQSVTCQQGKPVAFTRLKNSFKEKPSRYYSMSIAATWAGVGSLMVGIQMAQNFGIAYLSNAVYEANGKGSFTPPFPADILMSAIPAISGKN
jgi:hypothetical protein